MGSLHCLQSDWQLPVLLAASTAAAAEAEGVVQLPAVWALITLGTAALSDGDVRCCTDLLPAARQGIICPAYLVTVAVWLIPLLVTALFTVLLRLRPPCLNPMCCSTPQPQSEFCLICPTVSATHVRPLHAYHTGFCCSQPCTCAGRSTSWHC